MLTASSPCCIQRDFPICAAAGGIESPGGGVFKRCRWHNMVEELQVVEFSDGSQKLQVACHGGEIVESIESASGVSYHRRWRRFRWNLAGDLSVISWSSVLDSNGSITESGHPRSQSYTYILYISDSISLFSFFILGSITWKNHAAYHNQCCGHDFPLTIFLQGLITLFVSLIGFPQESCHYYHATFVVSRPANFGVIESTFTHIRLIMGRLLMNGNIHIRTVTNTSIFCKIIS